MKVTAEILPNLLGTLLKNNITPMVHSSPGLGKSDIIKQLAKTNSLKLIDLRLAQLDSVDLNNI